MNEVFDVANHQSDIFSFVDMIKFLKKRQPQHADKTCEFNFEAVPDKVECQV